LNEEALRITRKNLGKEHIQVATSLNNLALVLKNLENYQKAKKLLKEALLITKNNLGEEHIQVATSLNNLALIEYALGNY